jgi:hypothetical protein
MMMTGRNLSEGFEWLCGAMRGELFFHWNFDAGDLWWSEESLVLFPGYWGA